MVNGVGIKDGVQSEQKTLSGCEARQGIRVGGPMLWWQFPRWCWRWWWRGLTEQEEKDEEMNKVMRFVERRRKKVFRGMRLVLGGESMGFCSLLLRSLRDEGTLEVK